ncbi:MAG: Rrf2 family transcriptional regulator [Planctomycetota bacterium]|nr:MAG: Rrf2 family transcriptional regulator [Planctomycetota bacterium]REJ96459.1 MAG: Rrf2 family transcriptional regulator [Planctomycetota bacterium]REK25103.1 MAG: Rrf2 family transcriptional regulator [Planctomycetota bacterium]REK44671.1 MAG: Rrf2 family transcriptional regulator [Planctomycetota bacterium]
MISQTVEYALRAAVTLAQHDPSACTAQTISEITQVPRPYLSKLLQNLTRMGLIRSKRGPTGGFVLVTPADRVAIWNVIQAVEPIQRIHECPLGVKGHNTLCPLHRRLDEAVEMVEQAFQETTLADLLNEPGSVTPLCALNPIVQITTVKPAKKNEE